MTFRSGAGLASKRWTESNCSTPGGATQPPERLGDRSSIDWPASDAGRSAIAAHPGRNALISSERDTNSPKVRGPWSSSQSSAPILGTSWTGRTELDNHDTRAALVHEGIARAVTRGTERGHRHEAERLVAGVVRGVAGFEIGRQALQIDARQVFPEQRNA